MIEATFVHLVLKRQNVSRHMILTIKHLRIELVRREKREAGTTGGSGYKAAKWAGVMVFRCLGGGARWRHQAYRGMFTDPFFPKFGGKSGRLAFFRRS